MTTLRLGILYPDIMTAGGDRGNVTALVRRCEWRGIEVSVTELGLRDQLRSAETDLIMIGGGGESRQRMVAADLWRTKGMAIRDAVAGGAATFAAGGGFELFGRYCQPSRGAELPGIGLFDTWTVLSASTPTDVVVAAGSPKTTGTLAAQWQETLLVGFESRDSNTYLGPAAQPLGHVVMGYGNNGDGTEGAVHGRSVGTKLRGPCLPANPALTDFLIAAALNRRHGSVVLRPLPDELEQGLRRAILRGARHVRSLRSRQPHHAARGILTRIGQPRYEHSGRAPQRWTLPPAARSQAT